MVLESTSAVYVSHDQGVRSFPINDPSGFTDLLLQGDVYSDVDVLSVRSSGQVIFSYEKSSDEATTTGVGILSPEPSPGVSEIPGLASTAEHYRFWPLSGNTFAIWVDGDEDPSQGPGTWYRLTSGEPFPDAIESSDLLYESTADWNQLWTVNDHVYVIENETGNPGYTITYLNSDGTSSVLSADGADAWTFPAQAVVGGTTYLYLYRSGGATAFGVPLGETTWNSSMPSLSLPPGTVNLRSVGSGFAALTRTWVGGVTTDGISIHDGTDGSTDWTALAVPSSTHLVMTLWGASSTGRYIYAIAGTSGPAELWILDTLGTASTALPLAGVWPTWNGTTSWDGADLVTVSGETTVTLADGSGTPVHTVSGFTSPVSSVSVGNSGTLYVTDGAGLQAVRCVASPGGAPGGSSPAPSGSTTGEFTDVPVDAWYADFVAVLAEAGISVGYGDGTFRPAADVSRAEIAAMIVRALGESVSASGGTFGDVADGAWYAGFVNRLAELGVVSGRTDGIFDPDGEVTRAELAAMLVRALGESPSTSLAGFSDVPADVWYAGFVARLAELGVTVGYGDGTFHPDAPITRAEVAAMLVRAFDLLPEG